MLCLKPFGYFGCGQCLACRINSRRLWSCRIILESWQHGDNAFVTLTYAHDRESLDPRHLQLFMKRVRRAYGKKLRFFGVGEYGDLSERPHYHVALFGAGRLPSDEWKIHESWVHGDIHIGELTAESAAYIGGYVCKKMTKAEDRRLRGRHPEFARMSLKPGIGARAVDTIGSRLMDEQSSLAVARVGDVPREVRVNRRRLPLGRYLRSRLRAEIGWDSETPVGIRLGLAMERSLETSVELEKLAQRRAASSVALGARIKRKVGL